MLINMNRNLSNDLVMNQFVPINLLELYYFHAFDVYDVIINICVCACVCACDAHWHAFHTQNK